MALLTLSSAKDLAAARGASFASLALCSTAAVFARILSEMVWKAPVSVPPAYSTAAQITPPALAMKSGTDRTPRSCRAASASAVTTVSPIAAVSTVSLVSAVSGPEL